MPGGSPRHIPTSCGTTVLSSPVLPARPPAGNRTIQARPCVYGPGVPASPVAMANHSHTRWNSTPALYDRWIVVSCECPESKPNSAMKPIPRARAQQVSRSPHAPSPTRTPPLRSTASPGVSSALSASSCAPSHTPGTLPARAKHRHPRPSGCTSTSCSAVWAAPGTQRDPRTTRAQAPPTRSPTTPNRPFPTSSPHYTLRHPRQFPTHILSYAPAAHQPAPTRDLPRS